MKNVINSNCLCKNALILGLEQHSGTPMVPSLILTLVAQV